MSEFANVSVKLEANIYFDGAVTSRGITLADGSVKTLGVMLPVSMSLAPRLLN